MIFFEKLKYIWTFLFFYFSFYLYFLFIFEEFLIGIILILYYILLIYFLNKSVLLFFFWVSDYIYINFNCLLQTAYNSIISLLFIYLFLDFIQENVIFYSYSINPKDDKEKKENDIDINLMYETDLSSYFIKLFNLVKNLYIVNYLNLFKNFIVYKYKNFKYNLNKNYVFFLNIFNNLNKNYINSIC